MTTQQVKKSSIIAIDGLAGTGKTTAADYIAKNLQGQAVYGDDYLFEFMKLSPKFMDKVFGHPIDNMDARDYFLKYVQTPQQYSDLLMGAKRYIEEKFYWDSVNAVKYNLPSRIFDYSTISTMHPWVNLSPDFYVQKVLITADPPNIRKAIFEREKFDCSHIIDIFEESEKKLITPSSANFVVHNNHKDLESFHKDLKEVCDTISNNAPQDHQQKPWLLL